LEFKCLMFLLLGVKLCFLDELFVLTKHPLSIF
jgi:hypothetical protein